MLNNIRLVPITIEDYQFGYEIKKITLKEYTEQTWGDWNEEEQMNFYRKEFVIDNCFLIKNNNINIGWLKIIETKETIDINQILILPEYQGKGIGRKIINDIIKNGKDRNKTICLQVLKCNEKAKRLYIKLRFKKYDETKTHFFLNIK
jgi:ribosomal protein S18 acetylase RimI-like enzyme